MFKTFNTSYKQIIIFLVIMILPLCGLWNIGQATYIHAKAQLAQVLLETAWEQTLHGDKEVKPWPWADTWPVARLNVPSLELHRIVLAGANGSSLAFGPGHLFNSEPFNGAGNSLIAGHRDTHFSFLKELDVGDELQIQRSDGVIDVYKVSEILIADEKDSELFYAIQTKNLTLITCYPFTALLPGGPLRYVVQAEYIKPQEVILI